MSGVQLNERVLDHYRDYYDSVPPEWRRIGAAAKADNIVRLCSQLPHRSILEIGAGDGAVLAALDERHFGTDLFALEVSETGARRIHERRLASLRECSLYDGYTVPYSSGQFDLVVLTHVVEHLEHPRRLLTEAARVGRYLFIEVPLEDTLRLPHDFSPSSVGHINSYTQRSIRHLVQSCGQRVLHELVTNPPKASYTYRRGWKGLVEYTIKEALIRLSPRLATSVFTYHGALVSTNPDHGTAGVIGVDDAG